MGSEKKTVIHAFMVEGTLQWSLMGWDTSQTRCWGSVIWFLSDRELRASVTDSVKPMDGNWLHCFVNKIEDQDITIM